MGRQIRDSDAISRTGRYLEKSCKDLLKVKTDFLNHLDSMLNNYKGEKASTYGNMIKSSINKIDDLISTLDYFSKYMLELADHDNQNVQNTINKLKQELLESKVEIDDLDEFIC